MTGLYDSWQRHINYLRISITDHCNLNCIYCGQDTVPHLPHREILSYEEIEHLVRVAAGMGINKLRLTGGEPLLRPDIVKLVAMLSKIEGIDDISMTTNGTLLSNYAVELKKAGLKRVNISLDTLQENTFHRVSGHPGLSKVLSGIESARQAGLEPVKLNTVLMAGINDKELLDFARLTINQDWHIRFIELMPFGKAKSLQAISTWEVKERLQSLGNLEPYAGKSGNGPARYYRLPGARGTIGFISPVTEHFCHSCNRLRLTADGHLRPCLLDDREINLKAVLRNGATSDEIRQVIDQAVAGKQQQHHLGPGKVPVKKPMFQIGG